MSSRNNGVTSICVPGADAFAAGNFGAICVLTGVNEKPMRGKLMICRKGHIVQHNATILVPIFRSKIKYGLKISQVRTKK